MGLCGTAVAPPWQRHDRRQCHGMPWWYHGTAMKAPMVGSWYCHGNITQSASLASLALFCFSTENLDDTSSAVLCQLPHGYVIRRILPIHWCDNNPNPHAWISEAFARHGRQRGMEAVSRHQPREPRSARRDERGARVASAVAETTQRGANTAAVERLATNTEHGNVGRGCDQSLRCGQRTPNTCRRRPASGPVAGTTYNVPDRNGQCYLNATTTYCFNCVSVIEALFMY